MALLCFLLAGLSLRGFVTPTETNLREPSQGRSLLHGQDMGKTTEAVFNDGWRLVAVGGRLLVAVGGWRLVAVGSWRLVVVGSGWRLAVGGWRSQGLSLSKKKGS